MAAGKVGYVHIIAYSRSVRCLIVGAEKLHVLPSTQGSVEDQRNKMGFRFVILADFGTGIGPRRVKVSKSD